ncbi:MAG TPA: hypothetical protein VIQ53_08450 [Inquilinus sp.]
MTATFSAPQGGLRAWLKTDAPRTVFQSAMQQLYRGWRRFATHPLGLAGLAVILLLVIAAIGAPWLTS